MQRMPVDDEVPIGGVGEHAGAMGKDLALGSRLEECPHSTPQGLLILGIHGPVHPVGVNNLTDELRSPSVLKIGANEPPHTPAHQHPPNLIEVVVEADLEAWLITVLRETRPNCVC